MPYEPQLISKLNAGGERRHWNHLLFPFRSYTATVVVVVVLVVGDLRNMINGHNCCCCCYCRSPYLNCALFLQCLSILICIYRHSSFAFVASVRQFGRFSFVVVPSIALFCLCAFESLLLHSVFMGSHFRLLYFVFVGSHFRSSDVSSHTKNMQMHTY